jgi:hypothetical protein
VQDHTLVRREVTREEIEEGRLAGPVRTDDPRDLVLAQAEIDAIDSGQRTEALRDASGA